MDLLILTPVMLADVSPKKVLIVEDDRDIVEVMSLILTSEGYLVKVHLTGIGVPEIVSEFQPDVILLDIKLPGKDGLAVSKEVKEQHKVPIIFCSAHADEKTVLAKGCGDAFLKKPFDMSDLLDTISAQLVSC